MNRASLEYYERFWITETKNPCKAAKEALKGWISRHLGNPLIAADYKSQSRGKKVDKIVWLIYDGKKVYYATIICKTSYAEVKVGERGGGSRGLGVLAREAKAQGRLAEFPELSVYLG